MISENPLDAYDIIQNIYNKKEKKSI